MLYQPDGSQQFTWSEIGPSADFKVTRDAPLAAASADAALQKIFVISAEGEVWCGDYFTPAGQ